MCLAVIVKYHDAQFVLLRTALIKSRSTKMYNIIPISLIPLTPPTQKQSPKHIVCAEALHCGSNSTPPCCVVHACVIVMSHSSAGSDTETKKRNAPLTRAYQHLIPRAPNVPSVWDPLNSSTDAPSSTSGDMKVQAQNVPVRRRTGIFTSA